MRPSAWVLACLVAGLSLLWVYQTVATPPTPPAFAYGTGGALGLSGTIEIRVDGTQHLMTRAPCTRLLYPHSRLSHRELGRLRRLADTVRFARLPRLISSRMRSVDMAGRTISVYQPTGTITVVEAPYASNPRFDRLYAALSDAAPFTFSGPCRGNDP